MTGILIVSHCILNTASKVVRFKRTSADAEEALRRRFLAQGGRPRVAHGDARRLLRRRFVRDAEFGAAFGIWHSAVNQESAGFIDACEEEEIPRLAREISHRLSHDLVTRLIDACDDEAMAKLASEIRDMVDTEQINRMIGDWPAGEADDSSYIGWKYF